MVTTLLLLGVTLMLVASALLGRDAAERGRSSMIFALPFLSFPYTREHWDDVWWMALLRVSGFALAVFAVAIAVARDPEVLREPARLFSQPVKHVMVGSKRAEMNTFANSEEAILLAIRHDHDPVLTGRLRGEAFVYERAQVSNGVLIISDSDAFIGNREVRLLMDLPVEQISQRETWIVQPSDDQVPEVHVSWWSQAHQRLETDVIRKGYRLELQLVRIGETQLKGFMQLMLPDAQRSFLSGDFIAYTNNLRYKNQQVDLNYDHPDTLEYVARQYLETQFPVGAVRTYAFSGTVMKLGSALGETVALVTLKNGQIEERSLVLERSHFGWAVKAGSMHTEVLKGPDTQTLRIVQRDGAAREEGGEAAPAPLPTLTTTFAGLQEQVGRQLVITRTDGKTEQGKLTSVRRDRLQLEFQLGAGMVQSEVHRDEIGTLRFADGQPVELVSEAQDVPAPETVTETAAAAGPAETVPETPESAPAIETPAGDTVEAVDTPTQAAPAEAAPAPGELAAFLNKDVAVTGKDGRTRTGRVTAVTERKLTLTVQVGSGSLNYYYAPDEIQSIKASP